MTGRILDPLRRTAAGVALLLTPLTVVFAAAPGKADEISRYIVDTGPLRIRDQFLLGMGFLAFDPVAADVQPKGAWQVDVITTITNTFAHSA